MFWSVCRQMVAVVFRGSPCCDAAADAGSGLSGADPALWNPPHPGDQMDGSGNLTQDC